MGLRGREPKMLWDREKLGQAMIYANGEVIGFVFSVPKNYVLLVLLRIKQLLCFFCLKHCNLIFKAQIVILKIKISFGFVRGGGSSVLMFLKALLSVETISACLKTRQYFYSREVLRRRRLLKTLRILMPTRKRCLDNDERDFQLLVALSSAHVFLFAYKEEEEVDHPQFRSSLC